jgi:hypothetical protein
MKIIILAIILITCMLYSTRLEKITNSTCSFDNALKDNDEFIINDFSSFDELNFKCNGPINMSAFTVHPRKKIILDRSFNLKNLKILPINKVFMIKLYNLKGFEMNADPFKNLLLVNFNVNNKINFIHNSNFDFFIKNISLNDNCDLNLMTKYEWSNFLFKELVVTAFSKSNKYSTNICPLAFRNSYLNKLILNDISSSFLYSNEFAFTDLDLSHLNLNSTIFGVCLIMYHIELKNTVLNKDVYKRLIYMELNGVISSIQENLFEIFSSSFKVLCIRMQYIKNLFVKNNKWLQYLNFQQKITSTTVILSNEAFFLVLYQSFPKEVLYTYPDEDFCYFKDFPHKRLVFPVLKPTQTKNCSCALLYLIYNSYLAHDFFDDNFKYLIKQYDLLSFYSDFILQQQTSFQDCEINKNMQERIRACNFLLRLEQCSIKSIELNKNDFYFTVQDWQMVAKKSHLYLFISNQIVALVCLISNIVTLFIIRNKNINKEFKKTYTYLRIYTITNSFYIIICFTKFVCHPDLFECYNTRNYISVKQFKLAIVQLFGNFLKTTSNISFVSFTISRYIAMTSDKTRFFKIFENISLKKYLLITTIFSIIINIHIYFISYTNNFSSLELQGKYTYEGSSNNFYSIDDYEEYKLNFELSKVHLLKALQIIHIIFSDTFYIILVFICDLFLLLDIIKKMKIKTNILVTNNQPETRPTRRMLNLKRQIKNTENRMTNLVIFNGLNFLLFKLPSAIISLYSLIYVFDKENNEYKPKLVDYLVCRYFKFCESVAELAHFFYFFSMLNQFFLFYKLDKNFNTNLKVFLQKICFKAKITNTERSGTEQRQTRDQQEQIQEME